MRHSTRFTPALALAALALAGAPTAEAQSCVPFLGYVDLVFNGGNVLTSPNFEVIDTDPIPQSADCAANRWRSAVLKVTIPATCSCAVVWVEYVGEPKNWTLNVGDSPNNNGYGGDSGGPPAGQNAEVDVLDQVLTVWSAADNPTDVEPLMRQHLGLTDGALKLVVCDQSISIGQPFTKLETPDLERLFFLADDPGSPDNRTFYVGLNRTIGNETRNGCGLRRAMAIFQ